MSGSKARWWRQDDQVVVCDLCPHHCRIAQEGARGICGVRILSQGALQTLAWGGAATIHLDPMEKKPLYHFLPGTQTLSLGMFGCNLGCRHCQNWTLSAQRQVSSLPVSFDPSQIVQMALDHCADSISFTYNEPLISAEFWIEVAQECHHHGLKAVAVTNGYANPVCARDFFSHMDAANVDLKAFSERFYRRVCKGHLKPVLSNLELIRELGSCHLEITTLLIPTQNDSPTEIQSLAKWVTQHLGADTPLHFSAYHPDYNAHDWPPTPEATVVAATNIARSEGLHFVYTGNLHDIEGSRTRCPKCGVSLLERDGFLVTFAKLSHGACEGCGTQLPGVFP